MVLGNERFLKEQNVDVQKLGAQADALLRNGQTVVYVSKDGEPAGMLGVTDPVSGPVVIDEQGLVTSPGGTISGKIKT